MNILKKAILGVVFSEFMFFLFSLGGGLLIKLSPISEDFGYVYLITALSLVCFVCSIYISSNTGKAGLISGAGISAVVVLIVFLSVSTIFGTGIKMTKILRLEYLIPVLSGMVGGIIGANIKK